MITANELKVLVAIAASEYQDGLDRASVVGHHVWTMYVAEGAGLTARSLGGVVASLKKKGLAQIGENDGNEIIALTHSGFDALPAGWESNSPYAPKTKTGACMKGYGKRIDAVVYEGATGDFFRDDWIRLALAALDQADVSPRDLARAFQHARGDFDRTVDELGVSS